MIEDENADEFVRAQAIETLLILMTQNIITREEIIAYFKSLFDGKLERTPSYVWDNLVYVCCDLYPEELLEYIKQAYEEDLVNSFNVSYEYVTDSLRKRKDFMLNGLVSKYRNRQHVDTIKIFSRWSCFNYDKNAKPTANVYNNELPTETITKQPEPKKTKIGRNDPCGSGKKYKKCCGA